MGQNGPHARNRLVSATQGLKPPRAMHRVSRKASESVKVRVQLEDVARGEAEMKVGEIGVRKRARLAQGKTKLGAEDEEYKAREGRVRRQG